MNAPQRDLAELVVIPADNALAVFTTPGALDPILALVRERIDAFEADVSTKAGRDQVKSMAHAVSRSKSALESVGERLAKEAKELPKKIDAGRRQVKDTLDAWRDEVRRPLTEWESAEEARLDAHEKALAALKLIPREPAGTCEQIRARIAEVEKISDGADREEFADGFRLAKAGALASLREKLEWREKCDAEQEELAKLRADAAAREAQEAERRRVEAEEVRKKAEADALAQAAADAERREREAADRRAQAEREAAEKREADLKAQAEAAEQRAREAEAKAKAELDAKQAAERAEAERRERDKEHRAKINRAAVAAFVARGISEETAKSVVAFIAKREIPAISISY